MKKQYSKTSFAFRRRLEGLPLSAKILSLVIFATLVFPVFIRENELTVYFYSLIALVLILVFVSQYIIGRRTLKLTFILWSIGAIIYLCIAIPRIYSHAPLSPYMELKSETERWVYTLAFPVRLLGIFVMGLSFATITSPIEFLRWGQLGLRVALLFRAIQYATQSFNETRLALLMRNEWPEQGKGIIRTREAWLIMRQGPKLVTTTFRNVILWFPWAWFCYNKLLTNMKGNKT